MSRLLRSAFAFIPAWRSVRPGPQARFRTPFVRRTQSTAAPPEASQYVAKKTSLFKPTIVAIGSIPILCFALGTWQVERLKWKINLIDELEEKLQRDPLALPRHVKCAIVCSLRWRYLTSRP